MRGGRSATVLGENGAALVFFQSGKLFEPIKVAPIDWKVCGPLLHKHAGGFSQ